MAITVAFDGEFDAAALTGGGGPGGLPELVGVPIGGNDGDFGNANDAGVVSGGAFADAGLVGEASDEGITPAAGGKEGALRVAVGAVGKELGVFDAAPL